MAKATTNNNPGNLRYAGQQGATNNNGFAQFASPDDGYIALMNDLHSKVTGATSTGLTPTSTMSDLAAKYAPPTENDTDQYVLNLANQLKTSPDTPLSQLQDRVPELASAIAHNEDKDFAVKNKLGYNPKPFSQPSAGEFDFTGLSSNQPAKPQEQGFVQQTAGDIQNRLGQAGQAVTKTFQGQINPLSGILQAGGAIGGALGDVTSSALEHLPFIGGLVKGAEKGIGDVVGNLAQTDVGKSIVKSINDFKTSHPELSDDIGAGMNIATAIPILKGFGALKNIALDSASSALKGVAEKSVTNDLTSAASKTIRGRQALKLNPEGIKTLIEERAIPDIVENKYNIQEAKSIINSKIGNIEDSELVPALKSLTQKGASPVIDIDVIRKQALQEANQALEGTSGRDTIISKINSMFDQAKNSPKAIDYQGTKYLNLEDSNFFKRQARKGVTDFDYGSKEAGTYVGRAYMKAIEDSASQNGLEDIANINQKMARLIKAQSMLKHIEGRPVKTGIMGGIIKDVATGAGEMAGNASGVPLAGAFIGRQSGGIIGKKIAGAGQSILKRSAKDYVGTSLGTATKKTGGLIGSALAQKNLSH